MSKSICDDNLQVTYKHGQPEGIRDKSGFLLFFPLIYEYQGQDERYIKEVDKACRLASFLLKQLADNSEQEG